MNDSESFDRLRAYIVAIPDGDEVNLHYHNEDELKWYGLALRDPDIVKHIVKHNINVSLVSCEGDHLDHSLMHKFHGIAVYLAASELAGRSEFSIKKWFEILFANAANIVKDDAKRKQILDLMLDVLPDGALDTSANSDVRSRTESVPSFVQTIQAKTEAVEEQIIAKTEPVIQELTQIDSDGYFLDAKDCFLIIPLLILALKHPDLKDKPNLLVREILAEMISFLNGISPSAAKLWEEIDN